MKDGILDRLVTQMEIGLYAGFKYLTMTLLPYGSTTCIYFGGLSLHILVLLRHACIPVFLKKKHNVHAILPFCVTI